MPHATVALTAQYLNVRQRKLGTITIQTLRILQHESAVTDSLPQEEFVLGHSNMLNDIISEFFEGSIYSIGAGIYLLQIPYLVPTQFPELISTPLNLSENLASQPEF
jgi:hypothetical protein